MAEIQHLCMGCMRPIHENAVICPLCGYNSQSVQHAPYLPKGTILVGKYLVGKTIAFDSDSVTYIGFELQNSRIVQIHEFLPEKIIDRIEGSVAVNVKLSYERMFSTCIQAFIKLWRAVAMLPKPSALENVLEVFEENSTAYAISEYIDFITTEEYFSTNPPLEFEQAISAFSPIFASVSSIHNAGIIHAAISPLTVVLDSNGKLRLVGFSIAQTKSSINELHRPAKDGYAPLELYEHPLHITESTDVYSLSAVFCTAVTGIIPQTASQRALNDIMTIPKEIADRLPENAIEAIVYAMKVYPQERTQTINEFHSALLSAAKANNNEKDVSVSTQDIDKAVKSDNDSLSFSLIAKIFACIAVVCVIVFCTLYTTFLYKSMDIPMLNSAFSAFSFLPMNMDKTEPATTEASQTTTEPVTTEDETVRVPDFTSYSYQEIKLNAVFNRNFKIEYQFENSDIVPKDSVISQSISKGGTVNRGVSITLVISSGKAKIVLRDVIGQNYDVAYIMLTNDGFVIRKKVIANDGTQISNTVSTMSLVAGLEFEKGTEIVLTVWE